MIGSELGRRSMYYNVEQDLFRDDCRSPSLFLCLFHRIPSLILSSVTDDVQSVSQDDRQNGVLCAIIPLSIKKITLCHSNVAVGFPLDLDG